MLSLWIAKCNTCFSIGKDPETRGGLPDGRTWARKAGMGLNHSSLIKQLYDFGLVNFSEIYFSHVLKQG